MDRNETIAVVLLILIVADVSNASSLSNFQRFLALASLGGSDINQVSPSPSPDPLQAGANNTSNKTSPNDAKVPNKSDKVDSSTQSSNVNLTADPPRLSKGDTDKNAGKPNNNDKTDARSEIGMNCTGFPRRCSDGNNLVACILTIENEHQTFVVLAQNDGESNLNVDLSAPNPANSTSLEIPKRRTRKITLMFGNSNEVILKTADGECVLHTDLPVSQGNFFLRLPSYDKLITPINGAYFLIITVLIFGGMSICCFFRRRRRQAGIPYHELEMGLPESSISNNVETAEGWDQGWDEEWDEDNAVKTPAANRLGSISANGLSSRSQKKDEWETDWEN